MNNYLAIIPIATFFAGFVDSIGGGGGLISTPSLLIAGISPELVLGTNKCISTIGSIAAVGRYRNAKLMSGHASKVSWAKRILIIGLFAFIGAVSSTWKPLIDNLKTILPIILIFVLIHLIHKWYFPTFRLRSWSTSKDGADAETLLLETSNRNQDHPKKFGFLSLLGIGFYDGLLGPGTGIFFLSRLEKKGFKTEIANAIAKVFNISSNLGALLFFALSQRVDWRIGAIGASTYLIGNFLGAGLVLKKGQNLIRITVCTVACVTIVKLLIFS